MNFIALGFALPAALHNPWLHGAALVVLLVCLPRLLGIVYIPHTQVGIIEKIWSSKGSLQEGQIIARNGERCLALGPHSRQVRPQSVRSESRVSPND